MHPHYQPKFMLGDSFPNRGTVVEVIKQKDWIYHVKCTHCGITVKGTNSSLRKSNCVCSVMSSYIGKTIDYITILGIHGKDAQGYYLFDCKCKCGNTCLLKRSRLSNSHLHKRLLSCGCAFKGISSGKFKGYKELTGTYVGAIKSRARKLKLRFNLTPKYLYTLFKKQKERCVYTNDQLSLGTLMNASLDRRDSSKGYIKGNVQWVHKDINIMKNHFPEFYWLGRCKQIAKHCKQKEVA